MATVYDLVQIVQPGTLTSCRPGTWLIDTYADESRARETCELCNSNRLVPGLSYDVHAIDEEDPGRARFLADVIRDEKVPEGWSHVLLAARPGVEPECYERFVGGWRKMVGESVVIGSDAMNRYYREGMVSR